MLPRINGKDIIDCNLDDLKVILNNPDFAENEYLDYKKAFAINDVPKEQKQREQIEFRNDACSFANAQGGYLFFGVKEAKGIPTEFVGITLKDNNRDAFELDIKNYLQPIMPHVPYYRINFIELPDGKYIVILFIQHDYFAPYIHLAEQTNYKIYKRIGNSKSCIEYKELQTMFTQSLSLEKEIENFRQERIDYFMSQEDDEDNSFSQFLLMHIIPDTFLDSNYNKPLFALQQNGAIFSIAFNAFDLNRRPYPMVEGLRFIRPEIKAECRLYNNGVAEYYCPLKEKILLCTRNNVDYLVTGSLWDCIVESVSKYKKTINQFIGAKRVFVCISILGCKNVVTGGDSFLDTISKIDRDRLICTPVVFEALDKEELDDIESARLRLVYLTSLGINTDPLMEELLEKVYGKLGPISQKL